MEKQHNKATVKNDMSMFLSSLPFFHKLNMVSEEREILSLLDKHMLETVSTH